jgi:hypothetical protein
VLIATAGVAGCSSSLETPPEEPTGQPESSLSLLPWRAATSSGGVRLTVEYLGSECAQFDHVAVTDTPSTLEIFVYERATSVEETCSAVGVIRRVDLALRTPLNGRRIGGCGPTAPLPCREPIDAYTVEVINLEEPPN